MARFRYRTPVYSEEQKRIWAERDRRTEAFYKAHSKQTEKVYKVNDLYIVCISYLHDEVYTKRYGNRDRYSVQVWEDETRQDIDKCLSNKWFDTPEEANKWFLRMKAECEI